MADDPLKTSADDARAPTDTRDDTSHTPGETEVWQWLSRLAEDARKGRTDQANDDEWADDKKAYWGDQWDTDLPSFKIPIVVNELKTLMLNEVSDLTDNRMKIFVHKDAKQGDRDETVEKALQAEWERSFVAMAVMQAALDSMIYPAGFLGCFVKELPSGEKVLDVRAIDPTCVYPDPDAEDDATWRYVLLEEVEDLSKVRNDYPERGERVKPDDAYSIKAAGSSPWQMLKSWGSGHYKGPLSAAGGTRITGYVKARVAKLTLFIYDDETETIPNEKKDEQGNPVLNEKGLGIIEYTTKKKYPNGRMIVAANGVILYDDPYPYTGEFPIIRVLSEPTIHEFWLQSSPVRGVRALSQAGNKMDSLVLENGIRMNTGMVIADTSSGLKPGKFANMPGQILLKSPGSEIKFQYCQPMPDAMIKMGSFFRELMAKVLGFTSSRVGTGSRGNVSAELTETEISQAMGITRLRARLLHQSVCKLVVQMFHRMAQYYVVPRIIPYINASEWRPVKWQPIADPKDYGVHVDPASFSIFSESMLKRMTLALMKMGRVSTTSGLKTLGYPNAEEEGKKADQELMFKAMAKQNEKKKK